MENKEEPKIIWMRQEKSYVVSTGLAIYLYISPALTLRSVRGQAMLDSIMEPPSTALRTGSPGLGFIVRRTSSNYLSEKAKPVMVDF